MANPIEDINGSSIYTGDNLWSAFEENWLYRQYDNYANGGALYQALAPGEAQYSEWAQQMTATMYQNWYNSEPERMKRALAAGINPFVAASGIAGNGSGSVAPAPAPSNTSSFPNLVGSAAQGLSAVGGAFGNVASGIATLSKLRSEIRNIDQNTASEFEKMGFTKLQSKALTTQLKYLDEKEQISVWQALANFDKTKQEYQNLLATHSNILAQYDEIIAHKDLLIAQEGEVKARELLDKAMKDKITAEADWQKTQNDFFTAHGYIVGSPIFESIRDMMVSNGTFNMESFGSVVAGYNGLITSAVEDAKAAASWDYRPSNQIEAAEWIARGIGLDLHKHIMDSNGVSSFSEFIDKIHLNASAKREFNEGYSDAREALYEVYLSKKRYYRNIKRGGNSTEVARAYNAMQTAKTNFETFTKEKFYNELVKRITPRED